MCALYPARALNSIPSPNGCTLDPGETVTVETGSGRETDDTLYWGPDGAIWNNGGDTIVVTDDDGTVVIERTY